MSDRVRIYASLSVSVPDFLEILRFVDPLDFKKGYLPTFQGIMSDWASTDKLGECVRSCVLANLCFYTQILSIILESADGGENSGR